LPFTKSNKNKKKKVGNLTKKKEKSFLGSLSLFISSDESEENLHTHTAFILKKG
jgi:hypothetical protein